jgi:hypothetical protein
LFITRETVATETFAAFATVRISSLSGLEGLLDVVAAFLTGWIL